jgi:hypothetical protein
VSDDHFLSRWSRRNIASKATPPAAAPAPAAGVVPAQAGTQSTPAPDNPPLTPAEPAPLPPVESLTPESDFTPFMRADVDPGLRQQALRTLFRDPRFNVMDGLDVYIDDYSKPDPLPEGWLEKMTQVARLGEFRPQEPQTAAAPESAPAATQISSETEPEQRVADADVDTPADTPNKGGSTPEVGES